MGYTTADWNRATTKLIELTALGELQWSITDNFAEDVMEKVDRAYEVIRGKNRYVVKEAQYRHYLDEDEYYLTTRSVLEIYQWIEGKYARIARAPDMTITDSLFSAIESNFAKARGALDDLL